MEDKRLSSSVSLPSKSGRTNFGHVCDEELSRLRVLVESQQLRST
jgi:hypothetical protein